MRMGKKKQPTYRVVAADARSPRDGRFIEIIGTYEPARRAVASSASTTTRPLAWLRKGAQPTEHGAAKLLKISGAWEQHRRRRPSERRSDSSDEFDDEDDDDLEPRRGRATTSTTGTTTRMTCTTRSGRRNRLVGGLPSAVLEYLARRIVDDPDARGRRGRRGPAAGRAAPARRRPTTWAGSSAGGAAWPRPSAPSCRAAGARTASTRQRRDRRLTAVSDPPVLEVGRIVKPHGLRGEVIVTRRPPNRTASG